MPWTFFDRVDGRGDNAIRAWLDGIPLKARLKIDKRLKNLALLDQLSRPLVGKIKGYANLLEIVVEFDKVQYRPLGGYGPHQRQFTLVLGATESSNIIRPPDAFSTAARHIELLEKGQLRVCDHEYEKPTLEDAE